MVVRGAYYPKQPRDFFPTPREPIVSLLKTIQFRKQSLCDPCCGTGAMIKVFQEFGYWSFGVDIDPWPPYSKHNFITDPFPTEFGPCDIVSNPPYGIQGQMAISFIARSLEITHAWHGKVAMLLPMDFDSAKTRQHWLADNPAFWCKLVLLNRIKWFDGKAGSTNHAWFIWNWDYKTFNAPTIRYAE